MNSPPVIGRPSPVWWEWAPRVVAEALVPVPDPLRAILVPGPPAAAHDVAAALASALAPPTAADTPPPWLDPAQAKAFQLLLHALRAHGAALCAESAGSGKTYIALAVARALCAEPPACLVPAALVVQWTATARRLDIPAVIWSHSQLSRGRLPPGSPPMVIIDESHHFRNPTIRRYRTLAPWLIGRRVLLVSATPVVNRPTDLYHQLHLGLRDDVLATDGAPSLRTAFDRGAVPGSLGRFVIQHLEAAPGPRSREREERRESGGAALVPGLNRLHLSTHPEFAALIRTGLLCSAASSARALAASLRRYRSLLLQAGDAARAGPLPGRQALRQAIGAAPDQMVLWELFARGEAQADLVMEDLPTLESLIAATCTIEEKADEKSRRLDALLRDRVPTLVFVTARETITFLRSALPDRWLAWCTGSRSGIGGSALPRQEVLRWFRPGTGAAIGMLPGVPRTLITTDVSAEGLDLQRAGRVVHYDLPWTDIRLAQRNGRAVRRGSRREEVEIIRFTPGSTIEDCLRQQALLSRKSALPAEYGIGRRGRFRWRWRADIATRFPGPGTEGVAAVRSVEAGALAGVALEREGVRVVSALWVRDGDGAWKTDPAVAERRLREASAAEPGLQPDSNLLRELVDSLAPAVRSLLRDGSRLRISGVPPSRAASRIGRRLRGMAMRAARRREHGVLNVLAPALQFCSGGHTAGELALLESLETLDEAALLAALPRLQTPSPPSGPLTPRLTGLIVFHPGPP